MNTLIDFWADWCIPCKRMKPILEKVADDLDDRIALVKVNADEEHNADLMEQYDVRSIPTLVLVDETNKVLGKVIGAKSEAELKAWIERVTTKL
jgi:thioredoxin